MASHYWGIRPKSDKRQVRIEKAVKPQEAGDLAFGKGTSLFGGFQYKDFGTRVSVIRSDKQRIKLCTDEEGWTDLLR